MTDDNKPVRNLGEFLNRISQLRKEWGLPKHKELWFRGEAKNYKDTILRPELYRPVEDKALKPIPKLLSIEDDLYDEFQRNAVEYVQTGEDWDWDSYFLMQHHECPTRLLDWSDGALMAMHFALRDKKYDNKEDSRVYVLEPSRLNDRLDELPDAKLAADEWKKLAKDHPTFDLDEEEWVNRYLPGDDDCLPEMKVPRPPCVLEFPHITRRIAAQRSRFIVFGTEPTWLAEEFRQTNSTIKLIVVPKDCRAEIRQELRDCGVTESVIYPDLDGLGREMKQLWEDRRAALEENA